MHKNNHYLLMLALQEGLCYTGINLKDKIQDLTNLCRIIIFMLYTTANTMVRVKFLSISLVRWLYP